MNGQEIRNALHSGRLIFSTAVTAPSPQLPGLLSRAQVDFVFIDIEHTPVGRETLSWMCHAYRASGLPPVVRIPSTDPFEALKVLDGGAGGIIGPYVESFEQARALAGAARWRPLKGHRLEEALKNSNALEPGLRSYLEDRNKDTLLIINIESVRAIENLDAILSVPGIDAVLVGPHDLSCSLGIPEQYQHPHFNEAVRTIVAKARERGIGAGIHWWEGLDQEILWARAGANLIMHSADVKLISRALTRDLDVLRTALSGSPARDWDSATLHV